MKYLIAALILITLIGGGFFLFTQGYFNQYILTKTLPAATSSIPEISTNTNIQTPPSPPIPTLANTANKGTNCDNNLSCLISAASQCQPAFGFISSSDRFDQFYTMPGPTQDYSISSQKKYQIAKSSGADSCTLSFSFSSMQFNLSDTERGILLKRGKTDAQINTELQKSNDVIKQMFGIPTICPSNSNAITSYLTDIKNGVSGTTEVSYKTGDTVNGALEIATATYTTSSGQKLVCTATFSPKLFFIN